VHDLGIHRLPPVRGKALTVDRVDLAAGVLVLESLKKRRSGIYRAVPVPPVLLEALDLVHGVRELRGRRGKGRGILLWPWSRMTGWRAIHSGHGSRGAGGPARLTQGPAACLWRCGRLGRYPA
jgi:integrase/recombinase XerD